MLLPVAPDKKLLRFKSRLGSYQFFQDFYKMLEIYSEKYFLGIMEKRNHFFFTIKEFQEI